MSIGLPDFKSASDIRRYFNELQNELRTMQSIQESIEFLEACGAPMTKRLSLVQYNTGIKRSDYLDEAADLQKMLEEFKKQVDDHTYDCLFLLSLVGSKRDRLIMSFKYLQLKSFNEISKELEQRGFGRIGYPAYDRAIARAFDSIYKTLLNKESGV